jgi:Rnl2 family RNA ligase
MTDYQGYGKISETTKSWTLEKSDNTAFKKTQWVVTEKVHGANFCFFCDNNGDRVQCGKRKELLSATDDFFGYKKLVNDIAPKVQQIFDIVKEKYIDVKDLYVFGELFGGKYPHPDVEPVPNALPVQTGIWYCPDINFYVFDMAITLYEKQIYLDYEFVLNACRQVNLLCAEPLFIGKYEQANEFEIGFDSSLPSKFGLPTIEGNKAEGIVIKPMKEILVKTNKGQVRAILKKKIEEFSEQKFNQAEKQVSKNEISSIELLRYEIEALITENRLNNALSKLGRITSTDRLQMLQLLDMYTSDVKESLLEYNEEGWNSLTDSEKRVLLEEIETASKRIIFKYCKRNNL